MRNLARGEMVSSANTTGNFLTNHPPAKHQQDSAASVCHDELTHRIGDALDSMETACNDWDSAELSIPVTVIVPVYNERRTLPLVLDRIEKVMPENAEVIVVDDASTDGTSEWLASLKQIQNRKVLHRKSNHGKGSAVRLGIRHSRGNVVAIQDADLEYDPVDLLPIIDEIIIGRAKACYGSRYLQGDHDPSFLHRFGNQVLTQLSNCMTGQTLTDMETCHKAFDGDLIRSIALKECRFGFEPEITGKISRTGVQIKELPTGYQYRSYEEGKKITWKDGVAALRCMWSYRTPGWNRRAPRFLFQSIATIPARLSRTKASKAS